MDAVTGASPPVDHPAHDFDVVEHDKADDAGWNEFVNAQAPSQFFHRIEWRDLIETHFGYPCRYLSARRGSAVVGVCPLVHFRSVFAGNALISTPFLVRGGPIGESEDIVQALVEAAVDLAYELQVDYLELRNEKPVRDASRAALQTKGLYVNFRRPLAPDLDTNLKAIPRKQRAMVRKGMKHGLRSSSDVDIDRFYAIFCDSYRNLGTPVFSKGLFTQLFEMFPAECAMTTILHKDDAIASVISFFDGDTVFPYYGGGTSAARSVQGNDFMYWSVLERAVDEGVSHFDFGRSKVDTGSYSFKKNWGFEPSPMPYQYALIRGRELPNVSPTNPKFALPIEIWKRLPIGLTKIIGPPIARRVG